MIIKRFKISFTVKLQKEDWLFLSTYTLLELLKSIPKEYRRYDYQRKLWLVNNRYLPVLEQVQVYTEEEDKQGLEEFRNFLALLSY